MLPQSICFLDLETSGINAGFHRIIEIGIIKMENGKVTKKYNQLINPGGLIDPFIEILTGIKQQDVKNAPSFYDVHQELLEILKDSVIAAHSVRFDYGFLRQEFKRIGISFSSKHFCTVKLAKLLYPNLKKYNLDSIMENFNIKCKNRHRAYDDALVIKEFYELSQKSIKAETFETAVNIALKRPTVPTNLNLEDLDNIPETPGVYIFYGDEGAILYIGKSINLRDRVLSHFSNDHLSVTDLKIVQQIKSFEVIETSGELSALLTESTLIKKHQPLFNRLLRESRKMVILLKNNSNKYCSVKSDILENVKIGEISNILGVFKSQKQMREFLYTLAKEYKLCPRLLGLEKGKGACFYSELGYCNGACINKELPLKYNLRFDEAFYHSKIKPWKFDSPILIKEEGEKQEFHLIDKWCYLGSIKSEDETLEEITKEYRFDLDTYKILHRFIRNPKNSKFITKYSKS